jgi:pantoate--beta-alanine ligase
MELCQQIQDLRRHLKQWRSDGERIAFVPTMGNLHQGHLSLVEIAKQQADRVVVSIYVNPMQFSPDEDFASYPRTLDADIDKLRALDVDLVFTPDSEQIYGAGEQQSTFVEVPVLSRIIEGEFRPAFFRGVATVVLKLFNLVQPDLAVFGEKDFQQLLIIRKLVADLCLPIEIVAGEIRREADGLAMSSRNNYLSESERQSSRLLSQALAVFRQQLLQGEPIKQAQQACIDSLNEHGFVVDYVTLRETSALAEVPEGDIASQAGNGALIILAAARLGSTRLLDNLKL